MHFLEIDKEGNAQLSGYALYLNYHPVEIEEMKEIKPLLDEPWLRHDIELKVTSFAIANLVPKHLEEIRRYKEELISKTIKAVKDRLTKEINYWDHRANELRLQELAGKVNAKINSAKAWQRADEMEARLQRRLEELELERRLAPLPPVVIGGVLVIPRGLLNKLKGQTQLDDYAKETARIEQIAMNEVMRLERELGYESRDVSSEKW